MACADLTFFAPAERAAPGEIQRVSHQFADAGFFGRLMDYLPDLVLVLNGQRQIVYANRTALEWGGARDRVSVMGLRPGELLHCKNAALVPGGCGTAVPCRFCGHALAVLAAQAGKTALQEYRLTVLREGQEESRDLRVWATPTEFAGEKLVFVAMADVADEKRRLFLERIFLHDLVNTAMAVRGFWSLAQDADADPRARQQSMETLGYLTERMVEETQGQQLLVAAESDQLRPDPKPLEPLALLRELMQCYSRREVLGRRQLALAPESENVRFSSDPVLLTRVLSNMLKNAIEASPEGATVTLGCRRQEPGVAFWVHNPSHMPEEIQAQVFQRSFSTKQAGRGLGTHSMKFFTEKYLGGKISFTSSAAEGTTFTAVYPLALP